MHIEIVKSSGMAKQRWWWRFRHLGKITALNDPSATPSKAASRAKAVVRACIRLTKGPMPIFDERAWSEKYKAFVIRWH